MLRAIFKSRAYVYPDLLCKRFLKEFDIALLFWYSVFVGGFVAALILYIFSDEEDSIQDIVMESRIPPFWLNCLQNKMASNKSKLNQRSLRAYAWSMSSSLKQKRWNTWSDYVCYKKYQGVQNSIILSSVSPFWIWLTKKAFPIYKVLKSNQNCSVVL